MRTSRVTDGVVGMHPNDRLSWPFDDFADGLELGQRVCSIARGDQSGPAGHLALHGFASSNAATLAQRCERSALARLDSAPGLRNVKCVR